jgi:hypothetical protein
MDRRAGPRTDTSSRQRRAELNRPVHHGAVEQPRHQRGKAVKPSESVTIMWSRGKADPQVIVFTNCNQ